ncbi:MAG: Stp1/IreP family PP2C-type Ser/Thr phosphatase [Coriobacteriales bacterium]
MPEKDRKNDHLKTPQVYAARTDVGCVREHNEDSFIAATPLFVVADGMGGHEAGEVASEIAINTLLEKAPSSPDGDALANAVRAANIAIISAAANGTGRPGMGTTMTAAQVFEDQLVIAQVGDSRAYLLHEGTLQRITRDHSLVADLVEQGRITEEEARVHPQRSVITRALGSDATVEPDIYILRVSPGDRLLLCSDGLSGMVQDSGIASILRANASPQDCCDALIREALAAGGMDNVTCVVVDPLKEPEPDKPAKGAGNWLRAHVAPIVFAIAFVAILAAGIGGAYAYAHNSFFVIAEDGVVCVYRGLPGSVAGIKANWLEEKTDIPVDKLSPTTASRLEGGMTVDSLEDAQALLAEYRHLIGSEPAAGEGAAEDPSAGK